MTKLHKLFGMLEMIRKEFGGEYAPQQLSILLLAKERPGITHGEIAQIMGMTQASVSRNVTRLSSRVVKDETGNPKTIGFGLVENRSDELIDSRRAAVWLTPKGEMLMNKIAKLFG